jgi:hypothetical protein
VNDDHTAPGPDTGGEDRRRFLVRTAIAGAVAIPTVTSFSLDGLVIRQATASAAGSVPPPPNLIQDPGFDI